jgi:hypothetical protein
MIKEIKNYIPKNVLSNKNRGRSWLYGYNKKYDLVIISRSGQIGKVVEISNLKIALPKEPKEVYARNENKLNQYWEKKQLPKNLAKIKTIFQWNEMPNSFKDQYIDYIENEFDYREQGNWFMNRGVATYITGSHYMYLQWTKIDVGSPDFREANRALFIYWEACKADSRSFGMVYLKIRRSGFSFMGSAECINTASLAKDARIGILSKTGADAKKMFTDKVVPISNSLPFFFKPIQDGMDKPKSELAYRVPASKITKKNMHETFQNTDDNSYDGEKLLLLVHDESGKWVKPNNILNNWRVTKTCLRLGSKVIGKCMMGSTSNALEKGGNNFKDLYYDSDVTQRNRNGQTKSGMYALFIPMEWNMEGFIDRYGMPILENPPHEVEGIDGEMIYQGAIDYWEAEVDSLKGDADALNEYYRQFPRTESHAFRDESKQSIFNLTKLYQQIDYNDSMIKEHHITRGKFVWENGIKDTKVVWVPDSKGRFNISWLPSSNIQNNAHQKNGSKCPGNEHLGAFGCDSYDISGVVGGGGSNGAFHGLTKFHMDDAPSNEFFLEYIARPQTAEIFFEDVLMACVFYGMPILVENNKPRLLYHFKNRGYRKYCINRPDKQFNKLSKTEKELGGIPNSSEGVKQAHASAIESYIEKYIGIDFESVFRPSDEMGTMPFNRTLTDWAKFDINNRTKFDASISSGLAIMACQKHLYVTERKESKIKLNFARYTNTGIQSEIIR